MSSSDGPASKKRRLQRACDNCKKRKIRCDGAEMPGSNCTNCLTAGVQCTHVEVTKNLGSAQGYVQGLERRLLPDVDLDQELGDDGTPQSQGTARLVRNDDTHTWATLDLAAERLTLEDPVERVYGKSSNIYLERLIRDEKAIHFGQDPARLQEPPTLCQATQWQRPVLASTSSQVLSSRLCIPDPDLLASLVDLYFLRENSFLPLLHRPTFERSLAESRHLYDDMFGASFSWYALSVHVTPTTLVSTPLRSMIQAGRSSNRSPYFLLYPKLRLHWSSCKYILYVIYLQHLGLAETMWIRLGTAVRMAQEAGAHVNRSSIPNSRDELWKRVFWVLMFLDVSFATIIGRPSAIHREDFDAQYPIDCDDEYWDHPDPRLNFRQPTNKPSSLTFFIQLLKLVEILSDVQAAVYPMKRECKNQLPEPQVLTEFDAALNKWLQAMPSHLLWDPHRHHPLFFRQSAFLHMKFYFVQILTHRPYIPAPSVTLPAQTSLFPSLSICVNAARSCLRIVEAQKERGYLEVVQVMVYAYTAALVLLLSAWRDLPHNAPVSVKPEMKGVYVCMEMLKACERPWSQFPFVLGDTLSKLVSEPYSTVASSATMLRQQDYDPPGPPDLGVIHTLPHGIEPLPSSSQLYSGLRYAGRDSDIGMGYPDEVDDHAFPHPANRTQVYDYSQLEYPFNAPSGQR
ncbi:hypothetical protein BDZ89DRAFT_1137589 [Hymenopellis radicata]|nr:hypothetical protein BDZ89DRAFT_1137589 [Hymenopellis radicata]